ncbi:penicillin-binding protein 1A [Hirschia litorea]|uniref:Penicillin-binding protein 1A n=1 Tax=Hirschia litorea TaxID=1199156 RepID=A0ABW2II22_9PROT
MFRKLLFFAAFCVGLVGAGILGWVYSVTRDLPAPRELKTYAPPITSRVHAGDGTLVAEFARQHRVFIPESELPNTVINAFLSAEDKSFYEHDGIDPKGIIRGVLLNAIRGKRITGGSTITQQTVKNMLVGSERSVVRKVREAFVARRLEQIFTKRKILELYLNEIYLGGRSYGVGAASINYFGKPLRDLSIAECALLAAMPKAPGKVNPYKKPDAAIARRNWVISRMAINGYISQEEAEAAQQEPLTIADRLNSDEVLASAYFVEEVRRDILRRAREGELQGVEFDEYAKDEEQQIAAEKLLYEQGLSVRSTLDSRFQLAAQNALQMGLETYDRRTKFYRGGFTTLDVDKDWSEALYEVSTPSGAGDWLKAVVLAVDDKAIKIGLEDNETGWIAEESRKWVKTYKSKDGKVGLQKGDVILVTQEPPPNVLERTIMDEVKVKEDAPYHVRQLPSVEGALVAMDPHTGRVLAMAGGYSFWRSQYNRAVQASRQPGSSFKPIVYAAALDSGFTPASTVLDAPFVIDTPQGLWKPGNYEAGSFYGESTLRLGIEKSRNLMTARLAQDVGMEKIAEYARRFGIYPTPPEDATEEEARRILGPQTYLSRSLGSGDTTPIKMATAYSMLVNGGKRVEPVFLDRIQDRYGKTIQRRANKDCSDCNGVWNNQLPPVFEDTREQVIDPITAYQMVSMLEGVVQRGTASRVRAVGKPVAGKTGTTNDYFDAWFVGFSPDLVTAVWVGFDSPHSLGNGESGGRVAAPIFRDFMMKALEDAPAMPFRLPSGVRLVEVDAKTGKIPGPDTYRTIMEAFKPGTEPGGAMTEDFDDWINELKRQNNGGQLDGNSSAFNLPSRQYNLEEYVDDSVDPDAEGYTQPVMNGETEGYSEPQNSPNLNGELDLGDGDLGNLNTQTPRQDQQRPTPQATPFRDLGFGQTPSTQQDGTQGPAPYQPPIVEAEPEQELEYGLH